tara:strand:+ start:243 stop:557 length:315 start_codon:yes stop_codon:yes gene_type:complete
VGAVVAGAASGYYFSSAAKDHKPVLEVTDKLPDKEDRRTVFDQLAPKYDKLLWFPEMMSGINFKRHKLLFNVKGDVLEIAAGTGMQRMQSIYLSISISNIYICV